MSVLLKLSMQEYDRMILSGAFDGLRKRIELIHGELREMNPAGPVHDHIISFLDRWSHSNTSAEDTIIRVQCGLGIPELDSVPEPDIAWVRRAGYRKRRPEPRDVLLLIEVADSSVDYDLGEKQLIYATAGVKEYWVVNVPRKCVLVFRNPTKKGYRNSNSYGLGETVSPTAAPKSELDVRALFED